MTYVRAVKKVDELPKQKASHKKNSIILGTFRMFTTGQGVMYSLVTVFENPI